MIEMPKKAWKVMVTRSTTNRTAWGKRFTPGSTPIMACANM